MAEVNFGLLQPLAQVQAPDFAGTANKVASTGYMNQLAEASKGQEARAAEKAPLQNELDLLRLEQGRQELGMAAQLQPLKLKAALNDLEMADLVKEKTKLESDYAMSQRVAETAGSLVFAKPEDKAKIYQQIRSEEEKKGTDISAWPQTYGPDAEALAQNFLVRSAGAGKLYQQRLRDIQGLEVAQAKAAGKAQTADTKLEKDLRNEFIKQSKSFSEVVQANTRIKESAKDPSAAGDLALIFNYMKMLDPGSTVREGEFATAQNSAGVPERLRARYNSITRGERLSEDQRADFVGRASKLFRGAQANQNQLKQQYEGLATKSGVRPEMVTIDYESKTKPTINPTDKFSFIQNGKEVIGSGTALINSVRKTLPEGQEPTQADIDDFMEKYQIKKKVLK